MWDAKYTNTTIMKNIEFFYFSKNIVVFLRNNDKIEYSFDSFHKIIIGEISRLITTLAWMEFKSWIVLP